MLINMIRRVIIGEIKMLFLIIGEHISIIKFIQLIRNAIEKRRRSKEIFRTPS